MIKSCDISVVVQGPIMGKMNSKDGITYKCCQSIRNVLPDAEIILSTWEGSNINGIPADKVVYNKDPGSCTMTLDGMERQNNTNRMIVSTQNGILQAKRKYCLKLRSDMILLNDKFTNYVNCYPVMTSTSCVEQRIVTLSANNYKRGSKIIFTMNDWMAFGLTSDLMKFYDIELQDYHTLVYDEDGNARFEDNLVAEEYLWTKFLMKSEYYKPFLSNLKPKLNAEMIDLYYRSLADNVVICSPKQLGVNSLKFKNKNYVRKDFMRVSCFTHNEWEHLYKKYCDHNYKVRKNCKDTLDKCLYKLVFTVRGLTPGIYKSIKKLYNSLMFRHG